MKSMKKTILLLFTFTVVALACGQENAKYNLISIATLKKEVVGKQKQLIDVRTPSEYNDGFIDNAININIYDKDNFKTSVLQFDKSKPIYLYCYSGVRSKKAYKILERLGFTTVYDYSGGWKEWSH